MTPITSSAQDCGEHLELVIAAECLDPQEMSCTCSSLRLHKDQLSLSGSCQEPQPVMICYWDLRDHFGHDYDTPCTLASQQRLLCLAVRLPDFTASISYHDSFTQLTFLVIGAS